MLLDGRVKNIKTTAKAENAENVVNITTVTVMFEDLEPHLIEQLAFAEHFERFLTMELRVESSPTSKADV